MQKPGFESDLLFQFLIVTVLSNKGKNKTKGHLILPALFLVTTDSMGMYLQPMQVAQVLYLLQDGTSIHAVARSVSKQSRECEGDPGNRLLQDEGCRRAITQQVGLLFAPLCKREQEKQCQIPAKWLICMTSLQAVVG